jgi:hypothetical protein
MNLMAFFPSKAILNPGSLNHHGTLDKLNLCTESLVNVNDYSDATTHTPVPCDLNFILV